MAELDHSVQNHYTRPDLGEVILQALAAAGKDLENLKPEDLAPIDEFHIRGREASLELAERAGLDAGTEVLDIGSGIGGAARLLAARFGCRVTGLDLTEEYCRAATMLAEHTGLAEKVEFRQGNALDLPFEDGAFDLAWTQHAAMNIADKARLYAEARRVLKPGGKLAFYDILAGPGGGVHFPVPWARDPAYSFLVTPHELHDLLGAAGFEVLHWRDTTRLGRDWFRKRVGVMQKTGASALTFHVLLGADFPEMAKNQVRNLEENRIALIEAVYQAT